MNIMLLIAWATAHPLLTVLAFPALLIFTWTWYLALCPLKRARDEGDLRKLSPVIVWLAYLLLAGFLVTDFLFNLIACPVLFAAIPRDWLFTSTCDRYLPKPGQRGRTARWLCSNMLNPFDPSGSHCNPG